MQFLFPALFILMSVLFIGVVLAGAIARVRLKRKYPAPGKMVDIGGYKLHIQCQGSGQPTVVMEAGLGDSSSIWASVWPEVAKTTRVCLYDRAGLGWSEKSPEPRTAQVIVNELHTLLTRADIPGPYILAGHSFGGMYMRLFAHTYPDKVAGLVLVDASHEEQLLRAPEAFVTFNNQFNKKMLQQLRALRPYAALGIFALRPSRVPADDLMPAEAKKAYQATSAKGPTFLTTVVAETKAIEESLAQVRAANIKSLGNMPLIVLSRGQSALPPEAELAEDVVKQLDEGWQQMQKELAQNSSQGKYIVARQSGHYIHLQQPRLVIKAILDVLKQVRYE